jgi:curved DNA-binding protein
MPESEAIDYYEVLQLSPRADQDTIQRVFRHLAKRLHPDNVESGDATGFDRVMRAFEVLSDPARRAKYDAGYEQERENRWRSSTRTRPRATSRRIGGCGRRS